MYNDAGVNIHIHKMGFGPSDEDIEFTFLVAKALGCTGVTTERKPSSPRARPVRRQAQDLGWLPQPHEQLPGDRRNTRPAS